MANVNIKVRDFEAIKRGDLIVSGLTGLVGETNQGKSSTVRAIMYSLLNRSGREYIRHGAVKASVRVTFKDFAEHADFGFVWTKEQSSRYKLPDGTVLEKTGRTLPQEVLEGTGIFPVDLDKDVLLVNFLTQLDPPLLRDLSDTRMYGMIVKSLDGDKLQEAVVMAKSDTDQIGLQINAATIELELLQKRKLYLTEKADILKAVDTLRKPYQRHLVMERTVGVARQHLAAVTKIGVDLAETVTLIERMAVALSGEKVVQRAAIAQNTLSKLYLKQKSLRQLEAQVASEFVQVCEINAVLKLIPDTATGVADNNRLQSLLRVHATHSRITNALAGCSKQVEALSSALDGEKRVASLRRAQKRLVAVLSLHDRHKECVQDYNTHETAYMEVADSLSTIEQMVEGGVCPVCQTNVGEGCMDLAQIQKNIDELKRRKASMEGRMDSLREQKERIEGEIKDLGLDPDNLEAAIKEMEQKVEAFEKKLMPVVDTINKALADLEGGSDSNNGDGKDGDDEFDF